jgi:hypothetical protein
VTPDIPEELNLTLKALKAHRFDARFARTITEARVMMSEMISPTDRVGIGDSVTLRQMGIMDRLSVRGNEVINPFTLELTQTAGKRKLFVDTCRKALVADVFMTSCNAVTTDGKIVSVDYAGNRVAGTIFGAEKVILAIGRNKITGNIDEALDRIKNVITPVHARNKGRNTPCAVTGRCSDCDSPQRICSVTVILERKPAHNDFSIILIDEDLGLGWNPTWDSKRINAIESNYLNNSWSFSALK